MGNYMQSCRCSCVCVKVSSGADFAAERKRKLKSRIMVVHSVEGRVIEVGGAVKVAELMLEFPGHFVSECEMDTQDNLHMKRAAPLPADHEALPGRVYILFPMHKLHTRVAPHEASSYISLLNTHVVSSLHLASKKKKKYNGSKVTPLNNNILQNSVPPQEDAANQLPVHDHCPSDEEIDAFLQQFCSSHQQKASSIFSNNTNSTCTLVRSKSWIPKLETISESSILSA